MYSVHCIQKQIAWASRTMYMYIHYPFVVFFVMSNALLTDRPNILVLGDIFISLVRVGISPLTIMLSGAILKFQLH